MDRLRTGIVILALAAGASLAGGIAGWQIRAGAGATSAAIVQPPAVPSRDILRAAYDPIHFKPAIEQARDEQCLACHREVLDDRVRETSPAGVRAATSKAWYQRTSTYAGEQDTFHRRHLVTPMAKDLMNLACNTCHQGHDPRDEAQGSSATAPPQGDAGFTLRKQVNPETTCLKCHGRMNAEVMGLPGAWPETREMFGNSCLTCHAAIRTHRHRVSYLKAEAIEVAGQKNADVCYGCHGGRAWYAVAYPYPRHAWDGMPTEVPAWATGRPTASEPRFALPAGHAGK